LLAATAPSKICLIPERMFGVEGVGMEVIQAPKLEPRIMRYELSDYEWAAIKPLLPNEPRGVPRVDIGIFLALAIRRAIARST
jgi:hypothetical protein